ncbi:nuclear pore membrane glycoprotein 210-like [Watersipora subatra]|uniref:nuclear pore membrane glycoprotein 210-like n=1 Tax=Watersipora subatra TaxID=2589382 RepID=UPI00355C28A1
MWKVVIDIIFSTVLVTLRIDNTYGAKLNEPKVLLPYFSGKTPSSYLIEIHEARGCFIWKSSRPDVVEISEIGDPTCSNSATVTALHRVPERVTAFLLAESQQTGEILRCDVIVDSITSIVIETTTRELYLEDSPEKFQMLAHDDKGNTFSTLHNTPFDWKLLSDKQSDSDAYLDAQETLRFITFADSSYDTPSHIELMESQGLRGDTILVQGIKTGSAIVSVRLADPVYKDVKESQVRLVIIANIILSPPDAYILLFTSLGYEAHVIKQRVMHKLPVPSAHHQLEIKNQTVCSLKALSSEVYGEALGSTHVVLRDSNMPAKLEAVHQPSASIHVVLPVALAFSIEPGEKWVLESGRTYELTVHVLDKDRHKIHLSEDVRLVTEMVRQHFDIIHSSINGSYHVVTATAPGRTEITAVLDSVVRQNGTVYKINPSVENSQKVDIYNPLALEPDVLAFPWVPDQDIVYTGQFKASGGSGDYAWSTNDSSIADLGPKNGSLAPIKTKNTVGFSSVTVADVRNLLHFATAQVYVLPPDEMVFNAEVIETEVGNDLIIPLAVFGTIYNERRAFTDCRQLAFAVDVDNSVFTYDTDIPMIMPADGMSCTSIRLIAKKSGYTVLKASYIDQSIHLSASITVAAFDPLQPTDPTERSVLAVSSTRVLTFTGGPQPWVLDKLKYFETGEVDDRNVVSLKQHKASNSVHRLTASCLELGEQKVRLTVGNRPSTSNKHPAERSATVMIYCKEPAQVQLVPQVPVHNLLPPCPVTLDSGLPIPAHNYRLLTVHVLVTDDEGREFDNISSLHFAWGLSDNSLATLNSGGVQSVRKEDGDLSVSRFTWFQTLTPHRITGRLTVSLLLQHTFNTELELQLLEDPTLKPGDVTLFNHPDSTAQLDIIGGSGYFYVGYDEDRLVKVKYVEQSRQVLISPVRDGNLRVHVHDLCLFSQPPSTSAVRISGAHRILLQVRNKVQQGNSLLASVQVLDHDGNPLPASHFRLMNLKPKLDTASRRYISVKEETTDDEYTAMFKVIGVQLGTAGLSFVAQLPSLITSNVQEVQVFPPLRLEPHNVTLLVGAALQVQAVGGPHPQSSIKYMLLGKHEGVATVSGNGLVETSAIGSMRIKAQAIGTDDETGELIVYSEDQGEIHVVKMTGVKLYAPLSRLQTNTKMPLYAMGLDEQQTPFSFGNVFPPLTFKWSITNREVAVLQSVYHSSNIEMPEESRFSQQLVTRREGHVTVKLEVKVQEIGAKPALQQINNNQPISDDAHIQVFDTLELLTPATCSGQVLMTPNTEARLRTNRDSSATMSYKVQGQSDLVTVGPNGEIVSGDQAGSVSVIVTAIESFRTNQTLLLLINVKPVCYIMLNCETELNTAIPLGFIPVGSVLQFRVSSHDESGQRFDFTNSQIRFRPNRFDLLQVTSGPENRTVIVRAPSVSPFRWGGTILKAWDARQPRIADYVNINVQSGIIASPSYVVGDVICFSTKFLASSGESGSWSSSDPNSLHIDRVSGHGLALAPGTVSVNYNMTLQVTSNQVRIDEVDSLSLETTFNHSVTLAGDTYSVSVILNGASKTPCHGVPRPVDSFPYRCQLSADFSTQESQNQYNVNQLFTTTPTWSKETGVYGCSLIAKDISSQLKALLSTVDASLSLTAVRYDDLLSSDPLSLSFVPPFHVLTKEIYLTSAEPVSHIDLSATESSISYLSVKIEGRLSSVLHHSEAKRLSSGLYRVLVRWSTYYGATTEGSITLQDKLTGQVYDIAVHVTADPQATGVGYLLWNNTDLLMFVIACIVVMTVCLLLGYFAVFGARNSAANASLNDTRTFHGSPTRSPSASPAGDPMTPSWQRQKASPGRVALWSSGYEPQEANPSDISLFKRSPRHMVIPD